MRVDVWRNVVGEWVDERSNWGHHSVGPSVGRSVGRVAITMLPLMTRIGTCATVAEQVR